MAEVSSKVYIDLRSDAHEGLFDPEWAGRLLDRARDTPLAEHAFALCEIWKSTSNAFRMPWLLLVILNTFHDEVFTNHVSPSQKVIQALIGKLANDPILGLRRMQVQNLTKSLRELDGQISTVLRDNPPKFDREEVWKNFARSSEFALGTASLREMCHNTLLFGYEHYCKSCLDALPAPALSSSKKSTPSFTESFTDRFGRDIYDHVHNSQIMLAREVRHAFVHKGGRVDQKLRDAGIRSALGEKVTIPIELLRELFQTLKDGVDLLTDESLKILRNETETRNESGTGK
jgi:hypothetical protein